MQIWGITEIQASDALAYVEAEYPGVIFNREPEKYGSGIRCTLRMETSRDHGAKMSEPRNIYGELVGTPRRTVSADWDVHGAFMAAVYNINPKARIKTALVDMRGVQDFIFHYPEGGHRLRGYARELADNVYPGLL